MNEFLLALGDLMAKHGIQCITASDEWQGHPETGEDIQMCVQGETEYINLGKYIDSDFLRTVVQGRR